MDEFLNGNFFVGDFEGGFSDDDADFGEWQIGELIFKCSDVGWMDFNEETSVDFGKYADQSRHYV